MIKNCSSPLTVLGKNFNHDLKKDFKSGLTNKTLKTTEKRKYKVDESKLHKTLVKDFSKTGEINSKEDILLKSLIDYFDNNQSHIQLFLPIVNGCSNISLRILDWFITNYSKRFNIIYKNNEKQFNVYLEYKSQLKAYSKKYFDPFCRRNRIPFRYNDGNDEIITTIGQINFFRWAIKNNILNYVENNLKDIEKNMNEINKTKIKKVKRTYKKKLHIMGENQEKHSIDITANQIVNKHSVKIVVSFD